jgi:ABC-type uncharacterized transport system involved in gliding motility auxiliary subunit
MKKRFSILLIICLYAAALALINVLAIQHDVRFDMTEAQQHTLSAQTQEYLRTLTRDVHVTALHVGIPPKYLEDMFKEYERVSGGTLKTRIIDPLVDIGYASQFGNIITGNQKKAVVQSHTQRRDIDFTDDVLSEELLTNAIIRVSRENRRICFTAGHNEYKLHDETDHGLYIFNQLLETNNMDAFELLLDKGEVPPACDVLVLAGAQSPLTGDEEAAIDAYLRRGGDALFLIEHTLVTTADKPLSENELELNPSLNGVLNNWGVKVNKDIVVDLSSHASGDVGSPATNNYLAHRAIVSGLDYTFYVRPRSISIVPQRRETLKVAPIVLTQSAENAWGETDRLLNVRYDEFIDRAGPVPIAFVIWEPKEEGEASDTRIIVFTDADFLSNAYIGAYSNAQMGLNVVHWLSELDYKAFIDEKKFEVKRLDLISRQKKAVLLLLVLFPVLIALLGIIVRVHRG